jgi:hypothetical protein
MTLDLSKRKSDPDIKQKKNKYVVVVVIPPAPIIKPSNATAASFQESD